MYFNNQDKIWMQAAIEQACNSNTFNEVPVGAVVVRNSELIGKGGNSPITSQDPTAHAEINALRDASRSIGNYRLPGAVMYVTLEPCAMCMGAIIHARLDRVVFGARDPKSGAAVSKYQIGTDGLLNHSVSIQGGLLETACAQLLKDFFRKKRQ